jgi:Putative zinc-finger
MNRHLSTEQLSSYLDGEIGSSKAERIEEHLDSCPACRAQLEGLERLVSGLRRAERPSPPPALAAEVRRRIAAAPEVHGLRRRLQLLLSPLSDISLRPAFRTSAAMGLAILFSVFLLSNGLERAHHNARSLALEDPPPVVTVQTYFGQPRVVPPTTSEVAGREFIWSGGRWIQRGLEGKKPEAHVAAESPEGRAMLSKYSDLEFLLADGTPVVLRYRLATVELSGS